MQEAYDNLAISTENNDEATPRKKLSLTNRLESPFYTEPTTKASVQPLPSARARYSKRKKGEAQDSNANALPAVKDEVQRKGSVVLVSKSQTGETCFQVKTKADFKKKSRDEKRQRYQEFNVWLGHSKIDSSFKIALLFIIDERQKRNKIQYKWQFKLNIFYSLKITVVTKDLYSPYTDFPFS